MSAHKGNSELRKKLQGSLSKKLKVRGILMDYNNISNQSPGSVDSLGERVEEEDNSKNSDKGLFSSFSLPAHVADMANVLGVNVSTSDKGVGLSKKEDDVRLSLRVEDEVIDLDTARRRSENDEAPKPATSKPLFPGADDPRLKYMQKLKEKRGEGGRGAKAGAKAGAKQQLVLCLTSLSRFAHNLLAHRRSLDF